MFILRQAGQNKFSNYKVSEIRTVELEFKLVKVGELNIKKALEICGFQGFQDLNVIHIGSRTCDLQLTCN